MTAAAKRPATPVPVCAAAQADRHASRERGAHQGRLRFRVTFECEQSPSIRHSAVVMDDGPDGIAYARQLVAGQISCHPNWVQRSAWPVASVERVDTPVLTGAPFTRCAEQDLVAAEASR